MGSSSSRLSVNHSFIALDRRHQNIAVSTGLSAGSGSSEACPSGRNHGGQNGGGEVLSKHVFQFLQNKAGIRNIECASPYGLITIAFPKKLNEDIALINCTHALGYIQSWTKVVVTPTPSPWIQCCHVENFGFNIDLGDGVLQHWFWGRGVPTFLSKIVALFYLNIKVHLYNLCYFQVYNISRLNIGCIKQKKYAWNRFGRPCCSIIKIHICYHNSRRPKGYDSTIPGRHIAVLILHARQAFFAVFI